MASTGGVDVRAEQDLSVRELADYLMRCASDAGKLARMREALREKAVRDGTSSLADLVEEAALSRTRDIRTPPYRV